MVASQATMQQRPEAVALEMAAKIEEHAGAGDWEQVEELVVRIRSIVMQVPENRRRDVLLNVQRHVQHVNDMATKQRGDLADRLTVIRRGRHAAKAYTNAE